MNGEWGEDQVLQHFLDCFDIGKHKDGVVCIYANTSSLYILQDR